MKEKLLKTMNSTFGFIEDNPGFFGIMNIVWGTLFLKDEVKSIPLRLYGVASIGMGAWGISQAFKDATERRH